MSDFTSNFWSIYVVALTLGGIFGCLLLLWMTARKKVESAADNTTGHVWDGDLMEMNNPMPRWWMWLFVITSIFGLGYGLSVLPEAEEELARQGYDEKYGARPLRRVIQNKIEDPAAEMMLAGGVSPGDVLEVRAEGEKIVLTAMS